MHLFIADSSVEWLFSPLICPFRYLLRWKDQVQDLFGLSIVIVTDLSQIFVPALDGEGWPLFNTSQWLLDRAHTVVANYETLFTQK